MTDAYQSPWIVEASKAVEEAKEKLQYAADFELMIGDKEMSNALYEAWQKMVDGMMAIQKVAIAQSKARWQHVM